VSRSVACRYQKTDPAATLYSDRVQRASQFAGHAITSKAQERQLLHNQALNVHHGDLLTCVFKPDTALCVSSAETTPNLSRCRLGCSNIALTDRDAAKVAAEVDNLTRTLTLITLATPLRQRLTSRRDALDTHLATHISVTRST
jgi:hypothetical protein